MFIYCDARKRVRLASVFLLVCLVFIGGDAEATVMKFMEVEELARLSSEVIRGEVLATKCYWSGDRQRIFTAVQVRVAESFKGTRRGGETVTITQLGGEKDGMRLDYSGRPEFVVGEAVVLFTRPGRNDDLVVVALKQGKMKVEGREVVRDFAGITLLDEVKAGVSARSMPTEARRVRLSLDELRRRIARGN